MSRDKPTWVRRELGPASYRFLRVVGVVAMVIGVMFTGGGIYTGVKEHKACSSVWESRREFVIEQNRCFLNAARSEQFGPISGPLSNDFPKLLGAYKAVSMDMVRCNHNPTHPDNRALCQSFSQARQSCTDRRRIWAPIERRLHFVRLCVWGISMGTGYLSSGCMTRLRPSSVTYGRPFWAACYGWHMEQSSGSSGAQGLGLLNNTTSEARCLYPYILEDCVIEMRENVETNLVLLKCIYISIKANRHKPFAHAIHSDDITPSV